MKKFIAILLAAVMLIGLCACGSSQSGAASTTAAAAKTTAAKLSGTVSANGSTSMEKVIGVLSEQFMADNPGVTVTYDATGSGTGIESATNGSCDIGLSSRKLKDTETGLTGTTIALDGIAIIISSESQVTNLTLEQVADIYTGKITNWKDVGGKDAQIACIGREAGSGTRDGFESITKTAGACVLAQELTSTGAVIEAVRGSANAIGYASLSAAENQGGIRLLTVNNVACTEENVQNGTYLIQRPFLFVTKDGASQSDAAKAFIAYASSSAAAELIRKAGAVPVK